MTASPTPPPSAPQTSSRQTFALSRRLFAYNKPLFIVNLLLWSAVHASPALLSLAVSRLFGQLESAEQGVPTALAAAWRFRARA